MHNTQTAAYLIAAALLATQANAMWYENVTMGHWDPSNTIQVARTVKCDVTRMTKGGETCAQIGAAIGLDAHSVAVLNPLTNCTAPLPPKQILCLDPGAVEAELSCNVLYTLTADDSCAGLQATFSVSATDFKIINPNATCATGDSVCLSGEFGVGKATVAYGGAPSVPAHGLNVTRIETCLATATLDKDTNCADLAMTYPPLSVTNLVAWNTNIDCWNLKKGDSICVRTSASPVNSIVTRASTTTILPGATKTIGTAAAATKTVLLTSGTSSAPPSIAPSPSAAEKTTTTSTTTTTTTPTTTTTTTTTTSTTTTTEPSISLPFSNWLFC
ncbi:hypothetical protein BCR33DRAFT_428428 [Rhizoclosmatium globosum]|uniref:LysM domain-containing protein n=1 Tax=Rhizoclosmatium globosum TaxID=329046 RepID=A0A1Y2BUG7_9FUNG|nr:hypothetical protein BCR33DRAFT_428428 [Rhizoclosmatium globosum]|eukprot:ORY38324.1 hypothetical protein BCR33DRAFT_428428 [Rhizoclosmatium globosum]